MRSHEARTQRFGRSTLIAALPCEWRDDRPLQAEQPPNDVYWELNGQKEEEDELGEGARAWPLSEATDPFPGYQAYCDDCSSRTTPLTDLSKEGRMWVRGAQRHCQVVA